MMSRRRLHWGTSYLARGAHAERAPRPAIVLPQINNQFSLFITSRSTNFLSARRPISPVDFPTTCARVLLTSAIVGRGHAFRLRSFQFVVDVAIRLEAAEARRPKYDGRPRRLLLSRGSHRI